MVPQNYATARIDHRFSEKDTFFATYLFDHSTLTQPDEFNNKISEFKSGRQSIALEDAHIFNPQLANTIRVGFSRSIAWGGLTQPSF